MKQKPCNDDMFHIKLGNSKENREFFNSQKNWAVPAETKYMYKNTFDFQFY